MKKVVFNPSSCIRLRLLARQNTNQVVRASKPPEVLKRVNGFAASRDKDLQGSFALTSMWPGLINRLSLYRNEAHTVGNRSGCASTAGKHRILESTRR